MSSAAVPFELFSAVPSQFTSGRTIYRLVYVKSDAATDDVKAFITDTPQASTQVAIGWAAAGVGQTETAVANETTAPAGVTFTSPTTEASGISGGAFTANQARGLWVRMAISPGATAETHLFSLGFATTQGSSGQLTALVDSNAAANSIASGSAAGTQVGITLSASHSGHTVSYSLPESAVGRFQANASSGIVTAATTILRPSGPRTLAFLPYELYDGGPCPVVASQNLVRYVDPINGSDSNNGQTVGTAWQSFRGKTISNAVIYIVGTGTINVPSPWGVTLPYMGGSTIQNCTIRPVGETPVRLKTTATAHPCFAPRFDDGTYTDITWYKIEVEGWQHAWLNKGAPRLRWLRCGFINVGPIPNNQHHGWYVGYSDADVDLEWAYCFGIQNRGQASGTFAQMYGSAAGASQYCVHHCSINGGHWTTGWFQDATGAQNIRIFNNTFAGDFSASVIGLRNFDASEYLDNTTKLESNILVNTNSGGYGILVSAGNSNVDYGGTNTVYMPNGGTAASGIAIGSVGVARNPSLDANGVAQAAAEKGSGDLLSDIPVHTDAGLRVPSSLTNVDRGHYQHGPAQTAVDTWKITGRATSSDGTSVSNADFSIAVT